MGLWYVSTVYIVSHHQQTMAEGNWEWFILVADSYQHFVIVMD